MNNKSFLKQIILFPAIRIIVGIGALVGIVLLCELLRDSIAAPGSDWKNALTGIMEALLGLLGYYFLFRIYESREIRELSLPSMGKYSCQGFLTGFLLQSLFIGIIWISGGYRVLAINPLSFLLAGFVDAFIAGFIGEAIIRGIIFRIIEEKMGTIISLIGMTLLFAVLHVNAQNATILSVLATASQAGLLISSVYVYSRSLWFPIFLHFAWDFAEPAVYGGINPGITVNKTLFTSQIRGPEFLTGGASGPQNSLTALICCLILSLAFLWLARKKGHFINPFWMQSKSNVQSAIP